MSEFRTLRVEFLKHWRSGRRPNLGEFLQLLQGAPDFVGPAIALARMDLNERLLAGDEGSQVGLVLMILRKAGVSISHSQLLNLARLEFDGRWRRGERVKPEHVVQPLGLPLDCCIDWRPRWYCSQCGSQNALTELSQDQATCCQCEHQDEVSRVFGFVPESLDRRSYELVGKLGEGGMGKVFRSCDPVLKRDVAVKVLQPKLHNNPSIRARFETEARIMAEMQHPGVPPVYNLGRLPDGQLHYSMKIVQGITLEQQLEQLARQPEVRIKAGLHAFEQVCLTMAYAHSRNVVHRDLKPANIMVGEFGEVQVMDWGLAKRLGEADRKPFPGDRFVSGGTSTGELLGTLLYMSPEQAQDASSAGLATDVYALGAILCETLTGAPPAVELHEADRLKSLQDQLRSDGDVSDARKELDELSMSLIQRVKDPDQSAVAGLRRLRAKQAGRGTWWFWSLKAAVVRNHPTQRLLVPLVEDCLARPETRLATAVDLKKRFESYTQAMQAHAEDALLAEVRRRRTRIVAALLAILVLVSTGAVFWIHTINLSLSHQTQVAKTQTSKAEAQTAVAIKQTALAEARLLEIVKRREVEVDALSILLATEQGAHSDPNNSTSKLLKQLAEIDGEGTQNAVYLKALSRAVESENHELQVRLCQAVSAILARNREPKGEDLDSDLALASMKSIEAYALVELKNVEPAIGVLTHASRLATAYQAALTRRGRSDATHNQDSVRKLLERLATSHRDVAVLLKPIDRDRSREFARRAAEMFLAADPNDGAVAGLQSHFLVAGTEANLGVSAEEASGGIAWFDDAVDWIERNRLHRSPDSEVRSTILLIYIMRSGLGMPAGRHAQSRLDAMAATKLLPAELGGKLPPQVAANYAKMLVDMASLMYTHFEDDSLSAHLFDAAERLVEQHAEESEKLREQRRQREQVFRLFADQLETARAQVRAGRFQEGRLAVALPNDADAVMPIHHLRLARILALTALQIVNGRKRDELPIAERRNYERTIKQAFAELRALPINGFFAERIESEDDFQILRNEPQYATLLAALRSTSSPSGQE